MKYVIITGVSEGLGYEIARVFLEKGFQVVGLSRTKPDLDIIHIPTDFTKKESIEKSIEVIKEKYSQFSCVVCCAAVGYIESLDKDNYEHTDEMFQVNIIGQNHLLSGIADEMKQNISDLVFIGATIGYKGNTFMPMYSVTKWGVRGLIENWRQELKDKKCRVIGIHPGGLNTDSNIGERGRETLISGITKKPVGTLLDKEEVARFVYSTIQLPKNMEISEVIINRK